MKSTNPHPPLLLLAAAVVATIVIVIIQRAGRFAEPTATEPAPVTGPAAAAPTPQRPPPAHLQRSPIPRPNEHIRWPIPPFRLAKAVFKTADAGPPAIEWDQVHRHIDQTVTARGRIAQTRNIGSICFLNFTGKPAGANHFYVAIFKEVHDAFPKAPEDYFLDRTIEVTGRVQMHKGRPQIVVRDAAQIKVVQEKAAD